MCILVPVRNPVRKNGPEKATIFCRIKYQGTAAVSTVHNFQGKQCDGWKNDVLAYNLYLYFVFILTFLLTLPLLSLLFVASSTCTCLNWTRFKSVLKWKSKGRQVQDFILGFKGTVAWDFWSLLFHESIVPRPHINTI